MPEELDVAALSRRFGPMVLRRCRQLLRDEDDALDACQDVFVRLVERRRRLDDQYPSSLLYRMATNVCLNRIRDRTRRPETRDEETLVAIARAEQPGGDSEARLLLDWLFNRHPESSRTIVVGWRAKRNELWAWRPPFDSLRSLPSTRSARSGQAGQAGQEGRQGKRFARPRLDAGDPEQRQRVGWAQA